MNNSKNSAASKAERAGTSKNTRADASKGANNVANGSINDGAGKLENFNIECKSGFVTLIGRPNAGKSTLLNAIMGQKLAITSDTAQTTRHRFRAIYDTPDMQMVIVDTPGLHKPIDALGEALDDSAVKALEGVDVVALLIDASMPVGKGDKWVAELVKKCDARKILVISKTDIVSRKAAEKQMLAAKELASWDAIVCLSAKTDKNVDAFIEEVEYFLPTGPRWFAPGTSLDQPLEVIVAEFIREKILWLTHDEVPHACGVEVEELQTDKRTGFRRIWAVIYVEHDSQKGIIIGKKGSLIKEIGTQARCDLEKFFAAKVHLDLSVKVRKNWRRDANQVKRFGYGTGL